MSKNIYNTPRRNSFTIPILRVTIQHPSSWTVSHSSPSAFNTTSPPPRHDVITTSHHIPWINEIRKRDLPITIYHPSISRSPPTRPPRILYFDLPSNYPALVYLNILIYPEELPHRITKTNWFFQRGAAPASAFLCYTKPPLIDLLMVADWLVFLRNHPVTFGGQQYHHPICCWFMILMKHLEPKIN